MKNLKKISAFILSLALSAVVTGCGASTATETETSAADAAADTSAAESAAADDTAAEDTAAAEDGTSDSLEKLVVGATSTPHGEILEQVRDDLAAAGYDLEVVIFDDYVLPNTSQRRLPRR